jgi:hypothetical protein
MVISEMRREGSISGGQPSLMIQQSGQRKNPGGSQDARASSMAPRGLAFATFIQFLALPRS